jgi:hypothetical protein
MRERHLVLQRVASLLSVALLLCGCRPYILEVDVLQDRLDLATPPLDGTHTVLQSFTSQHPYLSEIELLPAVYESSSEGAITWQLTADDAQVLAEQTIETELISANVPLVLTFPTQLDSSGKQYHLLLEGTEGTEVGFWQTGYNSLDEGELRTDSSPSPGDLHIITRCRYSPAALLLQVLERWIPQLWLLLPLVLLLLIPGHLIQRALVPAMSDPFSDLAMRFAVSLAVVPVVLLWSSVLGVRWKRTSCLVTFALLALWAILCSARTGFRGLRSWTGAENRIPTIALSAAFLVILVLRLVQVRSLALPAWVDSPQHVLITRLLMSQGAVPSSYEPVLPVVRFFYHFGFHANTALFSWLSGLEIAEAMLVLGQVIGALCALGAYALTVHLTSSRAAGIAAAILVGLVSYLPAYYVSWGRYTQLAGMTVLPATIVMSTMWLTSERRHPGHLLLAGLLQAGLFLIHARVSVFAACFLAAFLLTESAVLLHTRTYKAVWQQLGRMASLVCFSLILSAPWLVRLATALVSSTQEAASWAGDPGYNAMPSGLLFIRNNRQLFVLAALGILAGLRRSPRSIAIVLLACALVWAVVNPGWAGVSSTNLLNNASAVISMFLPLSILGGLAFSWAWEHPPRLLLRNGSHAEAVRRKVCIAARLALIAIFVGYALYSGWGMVSVINPDTVLATSQDVAAMEWVRSSTPANAVFLINTRYWQLGMYVGTDGGYWIQPLTGRSTLLPTLPYVQGSPDYVRRISDLARFVAETKDVNSAQFLELLEQQGVTHVYLGSRGGPLEPEMFLSSANYRAVYESGAVWIFEVVK